MCIIYFNIDSKSNLDVSVKFCVGGDIFINLEIQIYDRLTLVEAQITHYITVFKSGIDNKTDVIK